MLPIDEELSKLDIIKTQMDSDATSFFPSAMWDDNSKYPKKETGCAFKHYQNDTFFKDFSIKTFNQDSNDSAILKKYVFYSNKCYILTFTLDTKS